MPSFVPVEELFAGRHFDAEIVVLCVRWYLSFKLSYRDLVSMMSERGIKLAHTTILRWVQHYMPEFEKRWKRYARSVGDSWLMDETYVKVRGEWMYLYHLNPHAERFVRSIKESCLDRVLLFGEASLRTAVQNFVEHYHSERNHQGLANRIICPEAGHLGASGAIQRRQRLAGMLNYYYRDAA